MSDSLRTPTTTEVQVRAGLELTEYQAFAPQTLIIESGALAGNSLNDSCLRRNPVLVPRAKAPAGGYPVVLVLSGLFGNGTYSFNLKSRDPSHAQVLDACVMKGEAPRAVYVFCDAMTAWGGSQFLNSAGTGRYEDYIVQELVPAIRANFEVSDRWCVSGGSSGGYGALHLASKYPEIFSYVVAIAPDSFFEASLLPDLYTAAAVIRSLGVAGLRAELESGQLKRRKEWHSIANAVAMGLCYAPAPSGEIEYPIDFETGVLKPGIWRRWKQSDPVEFLARRDLSRIKSVYLEVGTRDQFQLLYGTRQIRDLFLTAGTSLKYSEFSGNHFDIGERRPDAWRWLRELWL